MPPSRGSMSSPGKQPGRARLTIALADQLWLLIRSRPRGSPPAVSEHREQAVRPPLHRGTLVDLHRVGAACAQQIRQRQSAGRRLPPKMTGHGLRSGRHAREHDSKPHRSPDCRLKSPNWSSQPRELWARPNPVQRARATRTVGATNDPRPFLFNGIAVSVHLPTGADARGESYCRHT